ncbi:phage tail protein [Enterobacter roggenkampii]|uniref:phage tail protein n=1 Tax=Enterobacter roggenkampii TaxID=1812935 RepID=UPI001E57DCB4|nr:phage tail protein [Enterobacter roggenkampii]MCE1974270.1 phage tail protein [Enterobacter roggenkampii]MEB6513359.1 phage tail protein [Enterobacter roggenkampii]
MTAKYFAILTNQGAARLANAAALGTKLNLTQMAVGDANGTLPTPDPAQTKLVNQKRIAPLNMLTVDPNNTSQIIAEQIIPENEGGFWIREIGLYDDDGILIAVANCPETYKPQLQEGSGRTQTIRMILIVSGTSAIALKIDPAVVLATRQYVDDKVIEVKAYADKLMKDHEAKANPHKQYPLIENGLKEMADAGLVGKVLENLGLIDGTGFVGRLIAPPKRLTVSGTYIPSAEAKYVLAELQAPGGNGANAAATSSGYVAAGVGGSAGGYAKFLVRVEDITDFTYTVGLHAASSNAATKAGSTSFCGVICEGGSGTALASPNSAFPSQYGGNEGGNVTVSGTTTLTMIERRKGGRSGRSLHTTLGNVISGDGGDSYFSPGASGVGGSSGNGKNGIDGSGGSAANSTSNPGGGMTGGVGGDGLIIFWELA